MSDLQLLVDQLDILSLPTDKLILKFFAELGKIQTALANSENDQYGRILLSVGYHQDKEIIELDVIQANGLPALDSSGTEWHPPHWENSYQVLSVIPSSLYVVKVGFEQALTTNECVWGKAHYIYKVINQFSTTVSL